MKRHTPRNLITTVAAVAVLALFAGALGGCDKKSEPYPLELTDQQTLILGKDFSALPDKGLVDQSGEAFSFASTKGKPAVVTSIYTSCPMPDMCPMITSKVAKVQAELSEMGVGLDKYRIVLLSFDPERDTPEVMRDYAKEHGLKLGNAELVTGDKGTLDRVMDELEVGAKPSDDGTIMHNMRTYVVGADGKIQTGFRQSGWQPKHVAARVKEMVE